MIKRISVSVCVTIITICVLLTIETGGRWFEDKYWPVVSKLRIVDVRPTTDGLGSVINIEFTKYRNCQFLNLSWYDGTRDTEFSRVTVTHNVVPGDVSDTANRPTGLQLSGPWTIGMLPHELQTDSFAILTYSCHPFWLTTSDFYP